MWTRVSVSRWICVVSLAAMMLLLIAQAESNNPYIALPCCKDQDLSERQPRKIVECYEQEPRPNCNVHAFLIKNRRGRWHCINATSQWINDKLDKGELKCPPILSA